MLYNKLFPSVYYIYPNNCKFLSHHSQPKSQVVRSFREVEPLDWQDLAFDSPQNQKDEDIIFLHLHSSLQVFGKLWQEFSRLERFTHAKKRCCSVCASLHETSSLTEKKS